MTCQTLKLHVISFNEVNNYYISWNHCIIIHINCFRYNNILGLNSDSAYYQLNYPWFQINGSVKSIHANRPGEGIVNAAREVNADVIITGSRGTGKLRRTFLGSVSDYVLHHSDVPVIVCRHKDLHDMHHHHEDHHH